MVENEPTPSPNPDDEKLYSKSEASAMVSKRVNEVRTEERKAARDDFLKKYGDPKVLAEKAAEYDKFKEGQKTEVERLTGERDDYKTKYEALVAENEARTKLEDTRKKAKSLFDAAEINNHDGKAWRYVETLVSGEDDDEVLAARIKDAKDIFGVRSVGGSGRNTVPPKAGEKTIDDEIKELETARSEAIKNHDPVTAGELSTKIIALKMKRREASSNV